MHAEPPAVTLWFVHRQDSMFGKRDRVSSDVEGARWCVLRWLALALVLIALGTAGVSEADAHPPMSHWATGAVDVLHGLATVSEPCCHYKAEGTHDSEACSVAVHCLGCTVESAAVSTPAPSPAARLGLRTSRLPTGLAAGPGDHPPKALQSV